MLKALLAVCMVLLAMGQPAMAQGRVDLGWGRLFVNDALGDGQDRWRTGAYTLSRMRGPQWTGALPGEAGALLEFRLRADTIAPANLIDPGAGDRRYAGMLSLGLYTHLLWRGYEVTVGADLVAVGPQTGIGDFQQWVHGGLGLPRIGALDGQIGNAVYPTVSGEIGRTLALGDRLRLRPFVAGQVGVETLVRAGADLIWGDFGAGGLLLRDTATGLRYRGIDGARRPGVSLMLGGDVARVFASALMPEGGSVDRAALRSRLRAGVHWQGERASVFYGVSWLGPEFEGQDGGQVVGALNLTVRF